MASKPVSQLSAPEKEQLAVSYAAFVLSGQGAQVTAEAINSVLSAAGLTASVNLVKAFAKTLATRQVTDLIGSIGSSEAPAAEAPAAKAPAKGAEKAAKTAPPPPPAEEEEGMDMGGLFDWLTSIILLLIQCQIYSFSGFFYIVLYLFLSFITFYYFYCAFNGWRHHRKIQ